MTRSAGLRGLIFVGSPPSATSASRMAAMSTTAGTPVKSCRSTRAGWKEISVSGSAFGSHASIFSTCSRLTTRPSSLRSRFSSRTFSEKGRRATEACCWATWVRL